MKIPLAIIALILLMTIAVPAAGVQLTELERLGMHLAKFGTTSSGVHVVRPACFKAISGKAAETA